jgi:hypothetical protein
VPSKVSVLPRRVFLDRVAVVQDDERRRRYSIVSPVEKGARRGMSTGDCFVKLQSGNAEASEAGSRKVSPVLGAAVRVVIPVRGLALLSASLPLGDGQPGTSGARRARRATSELRCTAWVQAT